MITKDKDFYLVDVVFLVEDSLFRVPRAPFEQNSDVFRDMFRLPVPDGTDPDGSSDEQPLRLDGIEKVDFRLLLKALFPTFCPPPEAMSEWFSVLKLSMMWDMDKVKNDAIDKIISLPSSDDDWINALKLSNLSFVVKIRETAIQKLQTASDGFSSMQKILLGKECRVADWVLDGYMELIKQESPIAAEEEGLGPDSTLKLYRLRDSYMWGSSYPSTIEDQVHTRFEAELKAAEYNDGSVTVPVKPEKTVKPQKRLRRR